MPKELSSSILEHIGDGIISVDASLHIVFANSSACRMFNSTLVGKHIDDVIILTMSNENNDSIVVDPFREVLASGKEIWYNQPMRVESLETYVEDSASPIMNSAGEVIGAVVIFRDVTENVRMLTSIKLADHRYRVLFENTRSGIAVYESIDGIDFAIVDFNAAAEVIEGVRRSEVIGKKVSEVFKGVEDMKLLEVFRKVWKTGNSERIPCAWYEDHIRKGWRDNYVYKLPTGEIVAVYDDVTEKRYIAEKMSGAIAVLRDNENRYHNIFEKSPVPTVSLSGPPNLIITNANKAFCDFIGYSFEELVGKKTIGDITHPSDMQASLNAISEARWNLSSKQISLTKRYVRQDGKIRLGTVYLSKIDHGNGRIELFAQIIDITEQRKAEDDKAALLKAVENHRKAIARANSILSVECDVAMRMIDGSDRSLDGVIATAGRKLGAKWLCVATVGESRMLGRWTDEGNASSASILDDFKFEAKDAKDVRNWALRKQPYVGSWDGMPSFLSKFSKKMECHWMVIPVSGENAKGQIGVVMMAAKSGKIWTSDEAESMVGLATLLCVLAKIEKNRGELSRKIDQTILELSRTVASVGGVHA